MECPILLTNIRRGILRLFEGINETKPVLCVAGDSIEPERRHRNDFIIMGLLDGVMKAQFAELTYTEEVIEWGC